MTRYEVTFTESHPVTDGDDTTVTVADYDDVGSMFILELPDGTSQSVGKQLVDNVTELGE